MEVEPGVILVVYDFENMRGTAYYTDGLHAYKFTISYAPADTRVTPCSTQS